MANMTERSKTSMLLESPLSNILYILLYFVTNPEEIS